MKYDYTLFPSMVSGYLIIPKPCESLMPYKEIYDRFCSAIYMACMISGSSNKHMISESAKCSAYVRATLAEFSSIEECIQQLYPELDENSYLIRKSNNPAFHFLKLLRNYNIHLSESTLSEKTISVIFLSNPEAEHDMDVLYIDNLDATEILKLKTAKYYTKNEVEKFIAAFEEKQHVFGISQFLLAIVVSYSEYISKRLTLVGE